MKFPKVSTTSKPRAMPLKINVAASGASRTDSESEEDEDHDVPPANDQGAQCARKRPSPVTGPVPVSCPEEPPTKTKSQKKQRKIPVTKAPKVWAARSKSLGRKVRTAKS